jgi:transposase
MPQVDIITGEPRHRHWTVEEKLSLLAAAFAPGATVREIARRANVSTSQLYTWRKLLTNNNQPAGSGFAQVVTGTDLRSAAMPPHPPCAEASGGRPANAAPHEAAAAPQPVRAPELPAIELEVRGHKVRIPASMPPALASVVVRALVQRR